MPELREEGVKEIFGKFDADRRRWELALTGVAGGVSVVHGKPGQPLERVYDVARRGLGIAQEMTS